MPCLVSLGDFLPGVTDDNASVRHMLLPELRYLTVGAFHTEPAAADILPHRKAAQHGKYPLKFAFAAISAMSSSSVRLSSMYLMAVCIPSHVFMMSPPYPLMILYIVRECDARLFVLFVAGYM